MMSDFKRGGGSKMNKRNRTLFMDVPLECGKFARGVSYINNMVDWMSVDISHGVV
jgi:hypothetical protein